MKCRAATEGRGGQEKGTGVFRLDLLIVVTRDPLATAVVRARCVGAERLLEVVRIDLDEWSTTTQHQFAGPGSIGARQHCGLQLQHSMEIVVGDHRAALSAIELAIFDESLRAAAQNAAD